MPNDWFAFKRFKIEQSNAAFKVGTDGCLLGAWTPLNNPKQILDIGTGTGLVSLMLAQRSKAHITGVEIDPLSAQQAQHNFEKSPWSDRLSLIQNDVVQMDWAATNHYDFVVSNPPFFSKSTSNADPRSTQARHEAALSIRRLVSIAFQATHMYGQFSIILPSDREEEFKAEALDCGWHVQHILSIRPSQIKPINRIIMVCQKQEYPVQQHNLIIYNENRTYTDAFISLLKPFYLKL